jgi:beta-lactamase regulating signal transducer with metallopeptidase domain
MNGVWGLVQLIAVAGVLCSAGVLLAIVLVYPRVRPWLLRRSPERRSLTVLLIAMAPVFVPVALIVAAMVPKVVTGLLSVSDHCVAHHDGHAHICPTHLPTDAAPLVGWVLLLVAALVFAARVLPAAWRGIARFGAIQRLVRSMTAHDGDVLWFDEARPLAFTAGWLRPKTLVSTAVKRQLSPEGTEILLAHEAAHRRRRDPLQRGLVELMSVLLPARVRERLVADWHLAAEQSCDAAAANACGNSVEVARTILTVERALGPQPSLGVAFGGATLEARVQHMLTDPPPANGRRRLWLLAGLAVVALLVASPVIHHALETALEALLG